MPVDLWLAFGVNTNYIVQFCFYYILVKQDFLVDHYWHNLLHSLITLIEHLEK